MISKTSTVLAIAASTLVSAQTFSKCNPLSQSCPPDPAFGSNGASCDWTTGTACDVFDVADGTTLHYSEMGAEFQISKATDAPTITSENYIFFGRIDVTMQAAPGAGIVTSCVLESDDLDEVDLEWVGNDPGHVQSNYFSQGQAGNYDRGAYHAVDDSTGSSHTYSLLWTQDALEWIIDGNTVRTLKNEGLTGAYAYPQTPMQVKLGSWCAGAPGTPSGTVKWAGGMTDFSQGPFNAYYEKVVIQDFAGGNGPASGSIKQYVYTGSSGTWESIKVVDGEGGSSSPSHSSKAPSKPTHTKATSAAGATITGLDPKPSSTKDPKPTSKVTKDKTTMSTAAASTTAAANSTTSASSTSDSPASTTSSAPSQVSSPGAAGHVTFNMGVGLLAGAGAALAQLLL